MTKCTYVHILHIWRKLFPTLCNKLPTSLAKWSLCGFIFQTRTPNQSNIELLHNKLMYRYCCFIDLPLISAQIGTFCLKHGECFPWWYENMSVYRYQYPCPLNISTSSKTTLKVEAPVFHWNIEQNVISNIVTGLPVKHIFNMCMCTCKLIKMVHASKQIVETFQSAGE